MFVFQTWMLIPTLYGLLLIVALSIGIYECRSWGDLTEVLVAVALLFLLLVGPQLLVAWLVPSSPVQPVKVLT